MIHSDFYCFRRLKPLLELAFFWIAGLLFGIFFSCCAGDLLTSTMRDALFSDTSISGLLFGLLLPLLLTVVAVFLSSFYLLLPVVFLKAFLFAFVGMGILTSFSSSGWLIRCLLMFSDCLLLPVLWLVWIRLLKEDRKRTYGNCVIASAFISLLGWFDFTFIAPFLAHLISFGKG